MVMEVDEDDEYVEEKFDGEIEETIKEIGEDARDKVVVLETEGVQTCLYFLSLSKQHPTLPDQF